MTSAVPTVEDLVADPVTHHFDDMVNPPGLTNFLGAVQVDHDLVALRSINFAPVSHGDTVTGALYVDGRLFRSLGVPVTVTWRPDRVVREATVRDLRIVTTTCCPPGETGAVVDIAVTNLGASSRRVRMAVAVESTVTSTVPWVRTIPPSERNDLDVDPARGAVIGTAPGSAAVSVQGVDAPGWRGDGRLVEVARDVDAGATWRFGFVSVVGPDRASALATYDRVAADVPGALEAARRQWDGELAAVFEADDDRFGGSLPLLETSSEALRRLYWSGIVGVLYFRRDSPASVLGRTYDTLMPRHWQAVTFIWDYSLSGVVHALLDPHVMRRHLEHWISTDIHTHYGTEWLTGSPFGTWYSVNDYAMTRMVRDYVRLTGDRGWLARPVASRTGEPRTVAEHQREWATAWRDLRGAHALADYGGVENLLECVSTYTHEVAALNAANVWCMRVAADIAAGGGDAEAATRLRAEAGELAEAVKELYVDGGGYWNARQPDGRLVPVRHCYDFNTVGLTMAGDLDERQRTEMVDFFVRELQTPTWLRALSTRDADAHYSVRADHQWNGAYTAWPAEAVSALFRLGRGDVALSWLDGLASSTNQGPIGQGHFVDANRYHSGAPKAPAQPPYLLDWACSSSGSFASTVIESVFGVNVPLCGEVSATPHLGTLDPDARLRGLVVAGRTYDVTAAGLAPRK